MEGVESFFLVKSEFKINTFCINFRSHRKKNHILDYSLHHTRKWQNTPLHILLLFLRDVSLFIHSRFICDLKHFSLKCFLDKYFISNRYMTFCACKSHLLISNKSICSTPWNIFLHIIIYKYISLFIRLKFYFMFIFTILLHDIAYSLFTKWHLNENILWD